MISITIHEETPTADDMAELLGHIADQLRAGFTSGHHPGWELTGTEEPARD